MIYTEEWMGKWVGADWDGDAPLLIAPLGRGPKALWRVETPQHLPEVVWLPLPPVLRIWRAPRFQDPFGPQAHWAHSPQCSES